MTTLNADAARAARGAGAHALTDVTGFGLLGHVRELAEASGLAAVIEADAVPALAGVEDLLRDGDAVSGAAGATASTPRPSPASATASRSGAGAWCATPRPPAACSSRFPPTAPLRSLAPSSGGSPPASQAPSPWTSAGVRRDVRSPGVAGAVIGDPRNRADLRMPVLAAERAQSTAMRRSEASIARSLIEA